MALIVLFSLGVVLVRTGIVGCKYSAGVEYLISTYQILKLLLRVNWKWMTAWIHIIQTCLKPWPFYVESPMVMVDYPVRIWIYFCVMFLLSIMFSVPCTKYLLILCPFCSIGVYKMPEILWTNMIYRRVMNVLFRFELGKQDWFCNAVDQVIHLGPLKWICYAVPVGYKTWGYCFVDCVPHIWGLFSFLSVHLYQKKSQNRFLQHL